MSQLLKAVWAWTKIILLVLLINLTFVSCAYWLDHLRFSP